MSTGKFLANPYSALDAQGRPSGAFPVDPIDPATGRPHGQRRYVAAEVDAKRTVITQKENPKLGIAGRQRTVMAFTGATMTLPITQHHKMGVLTGDLIPADLETALACGLTEKQYVEPSVALSKAREAAIAKWTSQYGEAPRLIDEDAEKAAEVEAAKRSVSPTMAAKKESR